MMDFSIFVHVSLIGDGCPMDIKDLPIKDRSNFLHFVICSTLGAVEICGLHSDILSRKGMMNI